MAVILRFAGVVTFVEQRNSVVVLVPNMIHPAELRLGHARSTIPSHVPKLLLLEGSIRGGGDPPDAQGRHFELKIPRGTTDPDLGETGLVDLTAFCNGSLTIPGKDPDYRLSPSLLRPTYGSFAGNLATSRFVFHPGSMIPGDRYPGEWRLRYGKDRSRTFLRDMWVWFDHEGAVTLAHRLLKDRREEESDLEIEPGVRGRVVLELENDCSACGSHGDDFAAHCHLMANPGALGDRFPVPEEKNPEEKKKRRTSPANSPEGNNPQCSPAMLSI